jgi:pyruvate/2-oxoacid:ferredoxin oxidoreductase beta subunit
MAMIVAAHGIKYTATATIGYHADLKRKVTGM